LKEKYKYLNLVFVLLFLISFFALFFLEAPVGLGIHKIKNLSYFIPSDLLLDDSWYGVYFGDKYIGYSHSFMKAQELKKGGGYLLRNKTFLNMPILGAIEKLNLETEIILNKNYSLNEASMNLSSSKYFLKGNLKRDQRNKFQLAILTPTQKVNKKIELSEQIINSSFAPIFPNYLSLKKKASFCFFDPILNRKTTIFIENRGTTILEINNKEYEVFEFDIDVEGTKGKIYTNKKSHLLKQEFLGFEFIKEDPMDLFNKESPLTSFDLIENFTVPSTYIPDKESLKYVKAKITGIDNKFIINTFNQKVQEDGWIVEIFKTEPKLIINIPIEKHGFEKFLKEDNFIKFRNSQVEDTVLKIVGNEKDAFKIVKILSKWIDKNIKKVPTISIPNTLDVLHLKQGDCGELSALLVGFLRSLGIPSYVNIGIVYQDGKFFYHAWVSAFVGEWIDTDPALGQITADATHIKLVKTLKGQFEIFKFIDNLKIEILDFK